MRDTGKIDQDEMEQVLTSINETASYFGDPVLKRSEIKVGRRRSRGEGGADLPIWLVVGVLVVVGPFGQLARAFVGLLALGLCERDVNRLVNFIIDHSLSLFFSFGSKP